MGLSTGLIAAYNKQAGGASWLDLSGNGNNAAIIGATWETDGLRTDASGERVVFLNDAQQISLVAGTLIIKFKSLLSFSDSTVHYLFGSYAGALGNFAIGKLNDNNFYFLVRDGTSRYISLIAAQMANWESGIQIAVRWRIGVAKIFDGKNLAINIDGVDIVPNASSNATSLTDYQPIDTTLNILNNSANTANFAGGDGDYVYLFNTVKTEAELASINTNHNRILADYRKVIGNYNIPIIF